MKNLLIITLVSAVLFSCGNNKQTSTAVVSDTLASNEFVVIGKNNVMLNPNGLPVACKNHKNEMVVLTISDYNQWKEYQIGDTIRY